MIHTMGLQFCTTKQKKLHKFLPNNETFWVTLIVRGYLSSLYSHSQSRRGVTKKYVKALRKLQPLCFFPSCFSPPPVNNLSSMHATAPGKQSYCEVYVINYQIAYILCYIHSSNSFVYFLNGF